MIIRSSYTAIKRASVGGFKSYSFTTATNHICCMKGLKWLKFDGAGVLSLSLDGGVTYPITLDLTGVCDIITRSKMYANGNIMWANQTQCFYSTDNLATYNESTVLDINGDPFTPSTYDNFKCLTHNPEIIIDGIEMDVWGAYSIHTVQTAINGWYTIDSGITIKSCFLNNSTIPGQNFRHIHGFNYHPTDDSYWLEYGDALSGWNKGSYNWDADEWSWVSVITEDGSGYHKSTGIQFYNGYAYWTSDTTDAAKHGVWKCPYEDVGVTEANYVQVRDLPSTAIGLFGDEGVMIVANYSATSVDISWDYGVTWERTVLSGAPPVASGYMYFAINGGDDNGYYRADVQEDPATETEYLSASGITLLMQVIKTKIY